MILYCGARALAGAGLVPACCPQLLALGIGDERPVTPSIHGPGWGSKRAGGLSAFDRALFLCLLICATRCQPAPSCSLPILLISPSLPCVLRVTKSQGDSLFPFNLPPVSAKVEEFVPKGMWTALPIVWPLGPSPIPGLISSCLRQVWRWFRELSSAFPVLFSLFSGIGASDKATGLGAAAPKLSVQKQTNGRERIAQGCREGSGFLDPPGQQG